MLTARYTCASIAKLLVANDDGMLGQQSHMVHVSRPHHILDEGCTQLSQGGTLLDVKHHYLYHTTTTL